jgi:hypothetical protein
MRLILVLALTVIGCGPPKSGGTDDLGDRTIDDSHISTACTSKLDCDDLDPCTDDTCQQDKTCKHKMVDCTTEDDDCNVGMCDSVTKACEKVPSNEGGACLQGTLPGGCESGVCVPVPQCTVSFSSHGCSSFNLTRTATTSGLSNVSAYACAPAETGPELAYPFRLTTERRVTLTLTNLTADLDLIVLAGTFCTGNAACVAQSLNLGTSNESVTFTAMANTDYVIVIDGKAGAKGTFTLTSKCGDCAGAPTLACNMTVSGDTSTSTNKNFNGYICGGMEAGPENVYQFLQTIETNVTMKLKGLTQDLDLIVMGDSSGLCDPTWCRYQSITTGTVDENVSFPATASTKYWVAVDGNGATGGPYQLEVNCPASCKNTSNTLSCSAPSDIRRNDDPTRSRDMVDVYSCVNDLTGPEVAYYTYASTAGTYTVELTGTTADLDLIVLEGTFSVCDPTTACLGTGGRTVGSGNETVTFTATAGRYYWIVVDGRNGAVSNYTLKMRATSCPGPSCYQSANKLSCTYLEDQRRSDDMVRSKNAIDAWACDSGTTGSEIVYQFKPTVAGMYTVTLDGLSADLDLIVVSSTSSASCDSSVSCEGSSTMAGTANESVTFSADPARYYYLAVDGKAGAVSPYHIKVSSPSCPAPICTNGFRALSCPVTSRSLSNTNDASGATSDISTWQCASGLNGPEFVHQFTPTGPGPYTFELIGLQADLDLIVMQATATSTCDPAATCVAATATGTTSEKISNFTADPTKSYWLIVDGKNGAISPYTLAITGGCP